MPFVYACHISLKQGNLKEELKSFFSLNEQMGDTVKRERGGNLEKNMFVFAEVRMRFKVAHSDSLIRADMHTHSCTHWGPRGIYLRVVVKAHSWAMTSPGSLMRRHPDSRECVDLALTLTHSLTHFVWLTCLCELCLLSLFLLRLFVSSFATYLWCFLYLSRLSGTSIDLNCLSRLSHEGAAARAFASPALAWMCAHHWRVTCELPLSCFITSDESLPHPPHDLPPGQQ